MAIRIKVENKARKGVRYGDLSIGDYFIYEGELHMKIMRLPIYVGEDDGDYLAVNLQDGTLDESCSVLNRYEDEARETIVTPIRDVEIKIKM